MKINWVPGKELPSLKDRIKDLDLTKPADQVADDFIKGVKKQVVTEAVRRSVAPLLRAIARWLIVPLVVAAVRQVTKGFVMGLIDPERRAARVARRRAVLAWALPKLLVLGAIAGVAIGGYVLYQKYIAG